MTISIDRQDRTATAEILTLSSTESDPLYRIYRDGVLVQVTSSNRIVVPLPAGGSVIVEVRDDGDPAGPSSESFVAMEWDSVTATEFYRVERFDDPLWVLLTDVPDDGSPSFRFVTPQVDIDVSTQFRITPVGIGGVDGTAITPTVTIAGVPVPPDVTYSFSDSTKAVTVAAA